MTLVNYKHKNNAESTVLGTISAGATSLICASGEGARFPSTYPFLLTLEKWDSQGRVTKREIVKVTNRSTDAFTIVRSAGYCPADYSATTQTNTAFSFDTGDTIKLKATAEDFDDINAELVDLEARKLALSGGAMTGLLKEAQGANIASATTTDLSTATGNEVTITGTTTITSFGTVQAGTTIKVIFSGALTLTHNATSLILPNAGSNITTASGDSAIMVSLGSGNWKCLSYQRANGTALVGASVATATTTSEGINEIATTTEGLAFADTQRTITAEILGLATRCVEQDIPYATGAVTQNALNVRAQSTQDGSELFLVWPNASATQGVIVRLARENSNGHYVITHRQTITPSSGVDNLWVCPVGDYVYVGYSDGGTKTVKRYAKADLSGITSITISGTNWTAGGGAFSDGTDLYVFDANPDDFRKYSISGTTITNVSVITYTSAGNASTAGSATCDGTSVWIVGAVANATVIRKYPLAGGSASSSTTRYLYYDVFGTAGTHVSPIKLFIPKKGVLALAYGHCVWDATAQLGSAFKVQATIQP